MDTAADAAAILAKEGYQLDVIPETVFPFWGKDGLDETVVPRYPTLLTPEQEHERPAIILHSSGSVCDTCRCSCGQLVDVVTFARHRQGTRNHSRERTGL